MSSRARLRDIAALETAKIWSAFGTCNRLKVGACALYENGRIAGIGYNGADHGMDHCRDNDCNSDNRCFYTRHAERNCLDTFSGEANVIVITHQPCISCLKDILARGITRIVYEKAYTSSSSEELVAAKKWIIQKDAIVHQIYSQEWEAYFRE